MEKLIEIARAACDQAEVYSFESRDNQVSFLDGKLHDIETKFQSGLSLRIIKDGKLGFAYTRNLTDREEFLRNALSSLEGGVEANFDLPLTTGLLDLPTHDPAVDEISSTRMVEELTRVVDRFRSLSGAAIRFGAGTEVRTIRVRNTAGTDLTAKNAGFTIGGGLSFPGTAAGVWRPFRAPRFEPLPDEKIDEISTLYSAGEKVVTAKGGRMKVLFMPNSLVTLAWRLEAGTSEKSVYEGISPVAGKRGEKITSEKITVYDDPRNTKHPNARPFDDEGVACDRFTLIENGVLTGFFNNLEYAARLGTEPTGHGYRAQMFGGDPITLKPSPVIGNFCIHPGDASFNDLLATMDRGIIIEGPLGPHSGNIPNGDYSVGVSPGFYVENGEIAGRVKDVMISGNAYDTLKNVVAVGDTQSPCFGGWMPPILFDDVSVTSRS